MRTFVAIELTEDCRQNLLNAIQSLQPIAGGIKWSGPPQLHLTIKFIGEIPEEAVPDAEEALAQAAAEVEPFSMQVSGLSGFPPKGVPRVLFAAVQEDSGALGELQSRVENVLETSLGVEPEDRKFIPHVTLGRVKKKGFCPPLDKLQDQLQETDFGTVPVNNMVLIKSELTPDGPIYTPLHTFTLGESEEEEA
jgi:2'-5' RNA ligase